MNPKWKDIEKEKKSSKSLKPDEKEKKVSYLTSTIIPFLKIIVVYGLLINYAAFIILNIRFTYYSWPAYGIAYYFISEELTSFIRSIIPGKQGRR